MMGFSWQRVTGAVGLALILSCGGQPDGMVPAGRVHETEDRIGSGAPSPHIVFLVLDDDPGAATVRSDVLSALATSLGRLGGPCVQQGQWRGQDATFVIGRPSASGSARWVGPPDDPTLRVLDADVTAADEAALLTAASAALATPPAGGPNEILATVYDGVALLRGDREPTDDAEAALVASLPTGDDVLVDVVVASLREDESPAPVESYVPSSTTDAAFTHVTTIFESPETSCSPPVTGNGRLATWTGLLDASKIDGAGIGYPCGQDYLVEEGVLPAPFATCGAPTYLCSSHPVAVDEAGHARCHIEVRLRDPDATCDPARGWTDADEPLGEDAFGPYRACIMQHVPDDDLDACTDDPTYASCEGCASGYCPYRLPGPTGCVSSDHASIRFVGGAVAGVNASFEIRCRLEP